MKHSPTFMAFLIRKGTTREAKKHQTRVKEVKWMEYATKSVWQVWTMGMDRRREIVEANRNEKNSLWECMISGFHSSTLLSMGSLMAREAYESL